MTKNIMIVGVGGQGSLLASKLLGHLLLTEGYDVKVSEVHGMSQRGAEALLHMYVLEIKYILRLLIKVRRISLFLLRSWKQPAMWSILKEDGRIVTNTQEVDPMPVITGAAEYPENLVEKMEALGIKVDAMDCLSLATRQVLPRRLILFLWAVFPNILISL